MTKRALIVLIVFFILVFIIALISGRYNIRLIDFLMAVFTNSPDKGIQRSIIFDLRLTRTLMASFVGAGLSLSGLLYQETFRNDLVSPDLLGVSAGCSVGAAIAIILGLSSALVSLFSFTLGLIAVAITVFVARLFKNGSQTILLLSGVIINGLMISVLSFIKYFADSEMTLASITYWDMGTFQNAVMDEVWMLIAVVGMCIGLMLTISWRINLVALGREDAQVKGINYILYRYLIIVVATLLTAICTCFCGKVSWTGLVIPHMVRMIAGRNLKRTIPLCIFSGGVFMIFCDIISRTFTDSELPISAVTGLFGIVCFIIILLARKIKLNEY